MTEADRLLGALFRPEDGLVELRALPIKDSDDRTFVRPGDMAAVEHFIGAHQHQNLYFACAARRDSSNGRLENCSFVRALYCDVDFKTKPEPEARQALEAFPLQPSFVIHSGGGLHGYWLLLNPLDLQEHAHKFKALLKALARSIGADLSCAEGARVLRLPGSINWKPDYPEHPEVRIETADPDRVYTLADFEFLPLEPEAERPAAPNANGNGHHLHDDDEKQKRARAYLRRIPGAVQGQHGDDATYKAVAKMRDFGLSEEEAYQILAEEFNPRCDPPWTEPELREKVRNGFRYAKGAPGSKLDTERRETKPHSGPPPLTDEEIDELGRQREERDKPVNPFTPPAHWQLLDVAEVDHWHCPELEWIIKDILAKGNLVFVAADTQCGKTLLALYLILKLLTGGLLFGKFQIFPIKKVLYLLLEDPPRRAKARILDIRRDVRIQPGQFVVYAAPGLTVNDDLCFAWLKDFIRTEQFDLVVLDTYQKATPGISSFDDVKQGPILHRLANLTREVVAHR